MTLEEIKHLIDLVNQSDLQYLSFQIDNLSLILSKREQAEQMVLSNQEHAVNDVRSSLMDKQAGVNEKVLSNDGVATKEAPVSTEQIGVAVESPLVGVAYLAPSPDSAPFKQVGETVEVGEVVCIVEAMKIMNEIKSQVAGVVSEICVENGSIVEYAQPLLRITPN